ncbi:MAG: PAS domain-containing protein [Clostridiales bacterium]|nr:PAS domain-containing protein [Clostridiales bacterium]
MYNKEVLSIVLKKIVGENIGIIVIFDDDGKIIYMNETGKKELEYDIQDTDIQTLFMSFFPEDMTISEFIKSLSDKIIETVVYRKNNTCFNVLARAGRIDEGVCFNFFSLINIQHETYAVKELEKVQNTMKDATKSRDQFVANITHELRTPLNGIKGHITELFNSEEQSEKKRKMNIVLKCCENMENIVNNLLDFSKIEAGKFDITESPFNFRDAINHVLDTSIIIANEKGLKMSASVAPEIPDIVIGDELRIIQVLNNLVSNALKFTAIGYVNIEVYKTRLRHGRMELTFFVVDTGVGIGMEEREKLFKSFSQVNGSITRRYGGTGLGLFVTKQLVELMHGSISVESEKGKGSTFTFTIEVGVDGDIEDEVEKPVFSREILTSHNESMDKIYIFKSDENLKELKSNIEKLMLSIEMDNWEKAEVFSDNIKTLLKGAGKSAKNSVFKMQMAIRKENYEKSIECLELLKNELDF